MYPSPRIPFSELKRRLKIDHQRLLDILNNQALQTRKRAWLHTSFQAVLIFRLANYCRARAWNSLGRLLWQFNLFWTGADISEHADIQEGFVVCHPVGVAVMGTAGKNLTLGACAGLGGETGKEHDVGAGPGFWLLGDNVNIASHSGVLGPVTIGDNVNIGAVVVVTRNIDSNTDVVSYETRTLAQSKSKA